LLQVHRNQLVVIKFYAAYCKACRALAPKFLQVKDDPQLAGLPVVWAEFQTTRDSKNLFRRLGVLTLPTIHFYDGTIPHEDEDASNLIENFPCPPAKINLLKKKLARFVNSRVDPVTRQLQPLQRDKSSSQSTTTIPITPGDKTNAPTTQSSPFMTEAPYVERPDAATIDESQVVDQPRRKRSITIDNELITEEHLQYLRELPFFADLTEEEFDTMIEKAQLLTFNIGDVICKQGMPGTTFYVLKRGVVEMSVKSRFEDPIRTPPNYLGVVVGELRKGDYFGERALSTGEPLAASFRVVEKVRVFAFPEQIIPESSILHKNRRATQEMIEQLNRRYVLPDDYVPPSYSYASTDSDSQILDLLFRFKQIRQAARCFSYIMQTEPRWNNPGKKQTMMSLLLCVILFQSLFVS
jgi:thiol-disulfide isomerase/thioredoxin